MKITKKEVLLRFKDPLFVSSLFFVFLTSVNATVEDLTNWNVLINLVIEFIKSPVSLIVFITIVAGLFKNQEEKKEDKGGRQIR